LPLRRARDFTRQVFTRFVAFEIKGNEFELIDKRDFDDQGFTILAPHEGSASVRCETLDLIDDQYQALTSRSESSELGHRSLEPLDNMLLMIGMWETETGSGGHYFVRQPLCLNPELRRSLVNVETVGEAVTPLESVYPRQLAVEDCFEKP